jgi:hypothetical protein
VQSRMVDPEVNPVVNGPSAPVTAEGGGAAELRRPLMAPTKALKQGPHADSGL